MKKRILIDIRASEKIKNNLLSLGYDLVYQKEFPYFDNAVCAHPDMNYLKIADEIFNSEKIYDGHDILKYPDDVFLNAAVIGNDLICRKRSLYPEVYKKAVDSGMRIVDVKQGYAKCNIAVVSEKQKAIITEDNSIAEVLKEYSYNVLKLEYHAVKLFPYDYGFIGGASGLLENNLLAFCGNVESHPEYIKIKSFCNAFGTDIISLSDESLVDLGSLIIL